MDIVDIDEVLYDDSFCSLMEEKNQDDIANILQQWKNNIEQGIKCDTRTFIRPKRKSIQSLENVDIADSPSVSSSILQNVPVNLQIGGLVTNITKNPLQDISPTFSEYYSKDLSTDRMNNSLITSADFTNVSFFKTTNSEDLLAEKPDDLLLESFPESKIQNLSLSGEDTLIKDENIAQTDILYKNFNYAEAKKSINEEFNFPTSHNCNAIQCEETGTEKNNTFELSDKLQLFLNSSLGKNIIEAGNLSFSSIDLESCDNSIILNKTFAKNSNENNKCISKKTLARTTRSEEMSNINEDLKDVNIISEEQTNSLDSKSQSFEAANDFVLEDHRVNLLQSTPYQHKTSKNLCEEKNNNLSLSPIEPVKSCHSLISVTSSKNLVHKLYNDSENTQVLLNIQNKQSKLNKKPDLEINNSISDIELCTKQSEDEFDKMLTNFGRTVLTEEHHKMRQSIDNIKKRHSATCNSLVEDVKSTNRNSFSVCNERLLSRRGRLNDDISFNTESEVMPFRKREEDLCFDDARDNKICENNILCTLSVENASVNSNDLQNQERFQTMRIIKQPSTSIRKPQASLVRCYPKEKDTASSNFNMSKCMKKELFNSAGIDPIESHKRNEKNFKSNFFEKAGYNKVSEKTSEVLATSNLGKFNFENRSGLIVDTKARRDKRSLPTKAKSYQNLPSQFRFSRLSEQLPAQQQFCTSSNMKKGDSEEHVELLEQNAPAKEMIMETDNKLFKAPLAIVPMRISSHRKSGLIRPSSGFYSCAVKKVESELDNSRNSSNNSLSSVSSKGSVPELYKKFTYEHHSDDNIKTLRLNADTKTPKIGGTKSNIPKPSSLGTSIAKKSIIPLPSKKTIRR